MNSYELGKDIQQIKDQLHRIESSLQQAEHDYPSLPLEAVDALSVCDLLRPDNVLDSYEELLSQSSEPTSEEIRSFVISGLKENLVAALENEAGFVSVYDELPTLDILNEQEKALFQQDKKVGYQVFIAASVAEGLATLNWVPPRHNDNGDAFRHCYWSASMVKRVGVDWAKKWGDAHELGATGQPSIERKMDQWNNQVGRVAGSSGSFTVKSIMETVRSGVCRRIVNHRLVLIVPVT